MKRTRWVLFCVLVFGICIRADAEPVIAIFSSETGPYREALAGLKQELGESVPTFILSQGEPKIPSSTRVVITFGAKAALRSYSDQITLIYAMAPGVVIQTQDAVKICMEPAASTLLANLKRIQPNLKRLGILWQSPRFKEYVDELRKVAGPLGIQVESVSPKDSSDIPDYLRKLYGRIDAIWIPPDPLLLNATSLPVFMEFSRSNRVPLFVPTGGLVEQGATASVGPTFREMGRLAGVAARKASEGLSPESKLYTTNVEIVINKTVATQVGLQIPEDTLRKADKVIP